ncbi:hypothetical protein J7E73_25680 [Paenibacillus albidus]|uniref:hypothetical protein n=1 Tax=Paenibacillus albidus TaxID=2041023 RepID=UPI001BE74281|nr:hypothetical protein [Paenibacillus albidus]MBT2292463.1 hypothetical protein [Paenibacillus albidus]
MSELRELPVGLWIGLAAGLMLQGTLLFRDARLRGRRAWFWGLWGITGIPTPTLVYLLLVVLPALKKQDQEDAMEAGQGFAASKNEDKD